MSIRRARLSFEGDYVRIPNAWMRDERLTRRARGLLAEIMTHSTDWILSQSILWKTGHEGREAIRKAILELVECGYLTLDQTRGEQGRFGEANYVLTEPDLPQNTATQFLGRGRETGVRSTAPQESAPKEEHIEEDQEKKGGADALQPPDPWCPRHAATEGTDRPCTACKTRRAARAAWDTKQLEPWVHNTGDADRPSGGLTEPHRAKYDPAVYCEHLQLRGHCETCDIETERAAMILRAQFGVDA